MHFAILGTTGLAETCGIFVVRIDQQHVCQRIVPENGAQQQRDCAGLASAGGAQNGEMLAEKLIHFQHRRNRRVLGKLTNFDGRFVVMREGLAQFVLGGQVDLVAEIGIGGDAAAESGVFAFVIHQQFADKIKFCNPGFCNRAASFI